LTSSEYVSFSRSTVFQGGSKLLICSKIKNTLFKIEHMIIHSIFFAYIIVSHTVRPNIQYPAHIQFICSLCLLNTHKIKVCVLQSTCYVLQLCKKIDKVKFFFKTWWGAGLYSCFFDTNQTNPLYSFRCAGHKA
jgi:hypothetical protein